MVVESKSEDIDMSMTNIEMTTEDDENEEIEIEYDFSSLNKLQLIEILEETVDEILLNNNTANGVLTKNNGKIDAKTVVITAGTAIEGKEFIGHHGIDGAAFYEPLSPHPANFSAPKCRLATLAVILGQKNGGFALFLGQLLAKVSVTAILRHPLFGDCFFDG